MKFLSPITPILNILHRRPFLFRVKPTTLRWRVTCATSLTSLPSSFSSLILIYSVAIPISLLCLEHSFLVPPEHTSTSFFFLSAVPLPGGRVYLSPFFKAFSHVSSYTWDLEMRQQLTTEFLSHTTVQVLSSHR